MALPKWQRPSDRQRRHLRIRKKVAGTDDVPRLCVYRSLNHTYAQLIDDIKGNTILSVSTALPKFREKIKSGGKVSAAAMVGEALAEEALAKGLKKVVFDRGGYKFHGRVKAVAEAARKKGLIF